MRQTGSGTHGDIQWRPGELCIAALLTYRSLWSHPLSQSTNSFVKPTYWPLEAYWNLCAKSCLPARRRYLNLLSGQKSAFCPPSGKLWVRSKNGCHLLGWARRALPPCKVWERSNNERRLLGAKMWCLSVCFLSRSEAGALFVRGGIIWAGFVSLIMGRFWWRFQLFQNGLPFQTV